MGPGHSALWGWPGSPPISTEVPFQGTKDTQVDELYYTTMESDVHVIGGEKPFAKTVLVAIGVWLIYPCSWY